jgi:hypothetical protein
MPCLRLNTSLSVCPSRPIRSMSGRIVARAAGAVALACAVAACGADGVDDSAGRGPALPLAASAAPSPPPATVTPSLAQLPRGGRTILPRHRLVGFSGAPISVALGRLGIGDLDDRAREIERLGRAYAADREVLPVFELIATIATDRAGRDGQYRARTGDAVVREYLAAARRAKALLLLNIQPGRSDFLTEVKVYEKWLREPDVGVALDPEWAVDPGEVPGKVYGNTTGKELNGVARYLARVVAENDLPEKVMVFHQVARSVVRSESGLRPHRGVMVVKSVDGIGDRGSKEETWGVLTQELSNHIRPGFKLFFQEDAEVGELMSPRHVLALRPRPDYVLYE